MDPRWHSCCLVRAPKLEWLTSDIWTVGCTSLLLTLLVTSAVSEEPSGFISIDCGGKGGKDRNTNLEWVTDIDFLDSARELENERVATPAIVHLDDSTAPSRDNAEQLKTAMAFIPGRSSRSKYCYNLNVALSNINSTNYLVRAMFPSKSMIAKVDGEDLNHYGTRFYFTVDSTFISTIELEEDKPQTVELVVNSLDDFMYICLVPLEDMSSMAAISSLELRPLLYKMYQRDGNGQSNTERQSSLQRTTYLITVARLNFGGNEQSPSVRYPHDIYDRLWSAGKIPEDKLSQITSKRISNISFTQDDPKDDTNEPSEVLITAWEGVDRSSELPFNFNIRAGRSQHPLSTFCLFMSFYDVDVGENSGKRFLSVLLEESGPDYDQEYIWVSDFEIDNSEVTTWFDYKQTFANDSASFTITTNGTSDLPAMINSAQLFGEFEAVTERTAEIDALTIEGFSAIFENNIDTAGDPCLPVPWNWLVCNIEVPPRITQINLTSQGLKGGLPAAFGSLDRLTVLDLSDNSFTGSLPQTLADIVTLRALRIDNNNLWGPLPDFKNKSLVNLETISLRNNQLSGSLLALVQALDSPVKSLDVSVNKFGGSIPAEIEELKNLKSLDLSSNLLTGPMPDVLFKLPELETLNLQGNALEGMVPDDIWTTSRTQTIVNLAGNKFTVLNLTTWFQTLSTSTRQHDVTLVNNQIDNVILPTSHGDFIILCTSQRLGTVTTNGSILLALNPWCDKLVPSNRTLIERFLCRTNKYQEFCTPQTGDRESNKKTLIIVLVASGLVILLLASFVSIFLWRMWRRIKDLRQIQEALAKDDVRPPFYKYEELKAATKEFSATNELGKGAFGAVYKAELADKSIVAVKLLSPTDQSISEFLKEMVLITGIKHRHLVQLKGCCVRDKKRMLVYEYAENRNLAQALWGKDRSFVLTWAQRMNICVGIARGLAYLHEELQPKIIHRDIKAPNILLDKDWNAKIADFGLARPLEENAIQMATQIGGTLGYFSPEYATQGLLTEKLDVYSYGILVLEIVSGRRSIDSSLPAEELYLKSWAFKLYMEGSLASLAEKCILATVPRKEIESVLKTAHLCLQEDHEKRPSMSQVVNMLTGNSADVAIDIISELRDQQRLYQSIFDEANLASYTENPEMEDFALLHSTSTSAPQGVYPKVDRLQMNRNSLEVHVG